MNSSIGAERSRSLLHSREEEPGAGLVCQIMYQSQRGQKGLSVPALR